MHTRKLLEVMYMFIMLICAIGFMVYSYVKAYQTVTSNMYNLFYGNYISVKLGGGRGFLMILKTQISSPRAKLISRCH